MTTQPELKTERCRRVTTPEGAFWIPGCYARAHDQKDCTCPPRGGSNRDLAERVERLEARLESLAIVLAELQMRRSAA